MLVNLFDRVPDKFKEVLSGHYGEELPSNPIPGLDIDEHKVIILLDRQKPSVERCYDFDEERITLSRSGKIVWGFDSGCSCPSPFRDRFPQCYICTETWKEFEIQAKDFDEGWLDEVNKKIDEIILCIK